MDGTRHKIEMNPTQTRFVSVFKALEVVVTGELVIRVLADSAEV
jgi:hypothetical protein